MNLMKRAIGVFALTSIFGIAVVAIEPNPVSCAPTDGIIQTPPCASALLVTDEPSIPGKLETSPASSEFDVTSTVEEVLVAFLLF